MAPATARPYIQRLSKGQRAGKGQGNGAKEKGPAEKAKGSPDRPPSPGIRHVSVPAPTQKDAARRHGGAGTTTPEPHKGRMRPELAASLLATPRRQKPLEHIWQRTSLSCQQFASLYLAPLERYAELVQLFPASESLRHVYPGGMLDHGLEIVRQRAQAAAVAPAARRRHAGSAGGPGRSLDCGHDLRRAAARHQQDHRRSARRVRGRRDLAPLARPAAAAVPLPLP